MEKQNKKKYKVKLEHMSQGYSKQNLIFEDFNYEFKKNGLYLLYGCSGSGKTTLLNILYGIEEFQQGSIWLNGIEYSKKVDGIQANQHMAYITQDNYFVDYLTVFENMQAASGCDDKTIDAILERFGIISLKNQYPKFLSGGEQQRLAMAQALLQNKKILLLDEVTSALDYDNKSKVLEILNKIKKEVLIICAAHDDAFFEISDEVLSFENLKSMSVAEQNEENNVCEEQKAGEDTSKGVRSIRNLLFYMGKERKYKHREKFSAVFAMLSYCILFLLCFWCSHPEEKLFYGLLEKYHINYLVVKYPMNNLEVLKEHLQENHVQKYSFSYRDNASDSEYATDSIAMLPSDSDTFPYEDRLLLGEYISETTDVILGYNVAYEMAQDKKVSMEDLIGRKVKYTLFDGKDTFRIVGIFEPIEDGDALDTYLATGLGDIPGGYIYISDAYTEKYLYDDLVGMTERDYRKISFWFYFDSTDDLVKYYKKYSNVDIYDAEHISVEPFQHTFIKEVFDVYAMQDYFYPVIYAILCIALLFFYQTRKLVHEYNQHILCVYEYYGYTKIQIAIGYSITSIWQVIKQFIAAFFAANGLAYIGNKLNRYYHFMILQPFMNDWEMIGKLFLILLLFAGVLSVVLCRRMHIRGWYYILKDSRDLL